jgi:uncharacterized FlgJ-related protein
MTSLNDSYPDLPNLLSGWFHADFDLEGDTIEAIIAAFNAVNSAKDRQAIISDINRFMADHRDAIETEFINLFQPDIIATAFAPSTQAFLAELAHHLEP